MIIVETPADERAYYEGIRWTPPLSDTSACPECNGADYVTYGRAPGHPLFGKMRPCPTCCPQMGDQAMEIGAKRTVEKAS